GPLQSLHLHGRHAKRFPLHLTFHDRNAEVAADIEEIVLNALEQSGFREARRGREGHANNGIEFVHLTDRLDAGRILGNAGTVAEAGFPAVAGLRVNARKVDHARFSGFLTLPKLSRSIPKLGSISMPMGELSTWNKL